MPSSKHVGIGRGRRECLLLGGLALACGTPQLHLIHSVAHLLAHHPAKALACEDMSMSGARVIVLWDVQSVAHRQSYAIVDSEYSVSYVVNSMGLTLIRRSFLYFFLHPDFVVHPIV